MTGELKDRSKTFQQAQKAYDAAYETERKAQTELSQRAAELQTAAKQLSSYVGAAKPQIMVGVDGDQVVVIQYRDSNLAKVTLEDIL